MATILVKGLPEDVLRELKRLKVELGCKTWAELLGRLVSSKGMIFLGEKELEGMHAGVRGFLRLRDAVTEKWVGPPTVLSELRKARAHESG